MATFAHFCRQLSCARSVASGWGSAARVRSILSNQIVRTAFTAPSWSGTTATVSSSTKGILPSLRGSSFAVVHFQGKQFKVTASDVIVTNQVDLPVGTKIRFEKVLLAGSKDATVVGKPLIEREAVSVTGTVVEHSKAPKVIIFKKKRRKGYKRKKGFRHPLSFIRINTVTLNSVEA